MAANRLSLIESPEERASIAWDPRDLNSVAYANTREWRTVGQEEGRLRGLRHCEIHANGISQADLRSGHRSLLAKLLKGINFELAVIDGLGINHVDPVWKLYEVKDDSPDAAKEALENRRQDQANAELFLAHGHLLIAEVDVYPITETPQPPEGVQKLPKHSSTVTEAYEAYNSGHVPFPTAPGERILRYNAFAPKQIAEPGIHFEGEEEERPVFLDIEPEVSFL